MERIPMERDFPCPSGEEFIVTFMQLLECICMENVLYIYCANVYLKVSLNNLCLGESAHGILQPFNRFLDMFYAGGIRKPHKSLSARSEGRPW